MDKVMTRTFLRLLADRSYLAVPRFVMPGPILTRLKNLLCMLGVILGSIYFLFFIFSDGLVLVDPFNPYGWQMAGTILGTILIIFLILLALVWLDKLR
jgi:hypothetical protein